MKQLPQFNLIRSCDQSELEAKNMDSTSNVKSAPPIEIPIETKKSAAAKRHTISRATLQSYIIANKVELIHLNDSATSSSNNNKLSSSSSSSLASSTVSSTSISSSGKQENPTSRKPISSTWTKLDFKASRQQQQLVKQQQRLLDQQRQEDELKLAEFLFNSKRSLNTLLVNNSTNISRSLESLSSSSLQSPLSSLSSSSFNNNNNNNSCTGTLKIKTTLLSSPDQSYIMSKATLSTSPNTSASSGSGYALVDPNKIHLFVKGGQDGRSQGACPFCQDVFLQLLIKAETNQFNFDVITINLENPPKEFKDLAIKPPVLIHGRSTLSPGDSELQPNNLNAVILSDVDEIAEYLDRLYPNSTLTVENPEAKRVCLNVFSRFSYFIRDVASKSTSLEAELEKIDNYLRDHTSDESRFLNGKSMSALDCSLLPKLQHIRVAAESVKKFRIPYRFEHLWRYMKNAYETDAFQKSCPPDREIIWHWSKTNLSHKDILQIMQEQPYRTLTLPEDMKL